MLDGRRDDHLAHALAEVRVEALPRAEAAAAFEDELDAEIAPGHAGRLGAPAVADARAVDQEPVAAAADVMRPAPVDGVERQEMRRGAGIPGRLVDVREAQLRPPPPARSASRPMRPNPLMPTAVPALAFS